MKGSIVKGHQSHIPSNDFANKDVETLTIAFDRDELEMPFRFDEKHENIGALTYVCFLTTVSFIGNNAVIERGSVPLLGIVEEMLRVVGILKTKDEAIFDWLGGGVALQVLKKMGCVELVDEYSEQSIAVPHMEFRRAVRVFSEEVLEFVKESVAGLFENPEFLDWYESQRKVWEELSA